jgi:hypothetical protein
MNVKIYYRVTQDRAGIPQDFSGARRFFPDSDDALTGLARTQLAADYQVPEQAIEIIRIER